MTGTRAEALRTVVSEVEIHVGESGWDQPGRLFALVATRDLVTEEPELAAELGLTAPDAATEVAEYTAVEQEPDASALPLEQMLARIEWPPTVDGTVAVVQRLVLPPDVEPDVPDDPDEAAAFASAHPLRSDVRMGVGVLRDGSSHCVVRVRSEDADQSVLEGPDLVPALVTALSETLLSSGADPDDRETSDRETGDRETGEMTGPEGTQ